MAVTVGELLSGIERNIQENRRILTKIDENLTGLELLVGELKDNLPADWKMNIRYEKKGGTFSNVDLQFTVDTVNKMDVCDTVKEDFGDKNKVMVPMEKNYVRITDSSPVFCSKESVVKSEIPFNSVHPTKEAGVISEKLSLKSISLENLPPPGEFCDPVHIGRSSSEAQFVSSVEVRSDYKTKGSVHEKQFAFADTVRGAIPKVMKETLVPKQKVPPVKITPSKISFPAPFPVVPYDKPVPWGVPKFRVCQSEIGEISRFQMKMSGQTYNLDPTYFYEAPVPNTGEFGLKARGCFLCFSLKHNKKTHEKNLDPDLLTVVKMFVCYVCGRVGYSADTCVTPDCKGNKFRPKLL